MRAIQWPTLSGSYSWLQNGLQHSNLLPKPDKSASRQQRSATHWNAKATCSIIACYYRPRRSGTPQYQPLYMNTPTVLLAASHTQWQWRGVIAITLEKKQKTFASCQTSPSLSAWVCVRKREGEDISGYLWAWHRQTERVNNSWISVMCFRSVCQSACGGRGGGGGGETEEVRDKVCEPWLSSSYAHAL